MVERNKTSDNMQGCRKLFYGGGEGGLVKCWPPWLTDNKKFKKKKTKKNWQKRPKGVPQKMKLEPKYKLFKISCL